MCVFVCVCVSACVCVRRMTRLKGKHYDRYEECMMYDVYVKGVVKEVD